MPALMYFFIIPTFFPKKKEEDPEVPAEPVEPVTWLYSIIRFVGTIAVFAVVMLLLIYLKQESMLFVPGSPIQFIHENPEPYKSPLIRQLSYEEVTVKTKDGLQLQGWFMYFEGHADKDTVVFFHENAGNIGLRLDYFERLCKQVGVNVLCVAYRGYSGS